MFNESLTRYGDQTAAAPKDWFEAFSLSECEQLLISNGMHMTRKQVIESYMIFGGIPYYLNGSLLK